MLEADFYDYRLAIDPVAGTVVPNATAQVYAVDDTSFATPLPITDVTGAPLAQLAASPTGVFPQFMVPSGQTQVMIRTSSGVVTPVTSQATAVVPEATDTDAGVVRLAGDLGGTSESPTVPGLADKLDVSAAGEVVRDIVGQTLVGGSGVTLNVNDSENTITINASGGGGGGGGTVYFGSDANTARPASSSPIVWVGNTGVVPLNALDNDLIFTADPSSANNAPTATLTVTPSGLVGTATWTTNDVDGDTVTATNINWGDGSSTPNPTSGVQHTYASPAEYTVVLTISDGITTNIASDQVTVTDAGGSYLTDFNSGTIGATPSGWTVDRFAGGNTITLQVQDDSTEAGTNKVLLSSKSDALGLRAFSSWDTPVETLSDTDVEVVYKWRSANLTATRFMVLASGTQTDETALYIWYQGANSSRLQVSSYIDGVSSTVGYTDAAGSWVASTWMVTRVRVFNNEVMIRSWRHSNTEPETWQATFNVPVGNRIPGRVGVLNFQQTLTTEYDWIGCATGGLTAPKGT